MSRAVYLFAVSASIMVAATLVLMLNRDPSMAPMADNDVPVPAPTLQPEPISPLPAPPAVDAARVALGSRLFNDPILSADNSVSCASCHHLNLGGTDRRPVSIGIGGASGTRNAPSVFNAVFNFAQFWDGRAPSLEIQAAGPIHNPIEMGSNWNDVVQRLSSRPDYRDQFRQIYPDGVTSGNIADAIASFEKTLVTPNSRFDRYLRQEAVDLTADEIEGYRRFKTYGCASCHQGRNVGGNLYQPFGVMGDFFADNPGRMTPDVGRYEVTRREEDRYVFKVPSLRNVAVTGPYFHDGSIAKLEDAVGIMGRYQLGRALTEEDKRLITAFLHTLTGQYAGRTLE